MSGRGALLLFSSQPINNAAALTARKVRRDRGKARHACTSELGQREHPDIPVGSTFGGRCDALYPGLLALLDLPDS